MSERTPEEAIDVVKGARRFRRAEIGNFRISHTVTPPHLHIPSHHHERAVVAVVVEGRLRKTMNGDEFDCLNGYALVTPPAELHSDRWFEAESHHLLLEPDPEHHAELGPVERVVESPTHVRHPIFTSLAERMIRELETEDPTAPLALEGLALELLVRLRRTNGDRAQAGDEPPEWLLRVRDLLHDRFRESIRIGDLADEAGVHPSHLSRAFSDHFGLGPADYLRRLRLEGAKRDLVDTDLPLSRVAYRNGFSDQSHLTRMLRRDTGLTPARFRELHR